LRTDLDPSTLSVWYLDDGTVVGSVAQVSLAWDIIREEMVKVDLQVNLRKCELFTAQSSIRGDLSDIPRVAGEGFELLGAPIGSPNFCEAYVMRRVQKIREALKNLTVIDDPQVELSLLRSCMGMPRFTFALRSAAPSHIKHALEEFDDLMSKTLQDRLSTPLTADQRPKPGSLWRWAASGSCARPTVLRRRS
jgi:hypothetical protein